MRKRPLPYGVLIEVLENWTKQDLRNNRLYVQILEKSESVAQILVGGIHYTESSKSIDLLCKKTAEIDIYDDEGKHLNGESPKDLYAAIIEIGDYDLLRTTPVGIEIWFDDPSQKGAEMQYCIAAHDYLIADDRLVLRYDLDQQSLDTHIDDAFTILLKSQYTPNQAQ